MRWLSDALWQQPLNPLPSLLLPLPRRFTLSVSIVALYATRVWRKPAAIGAEIQALGRAPRTRKRAGR